METGYIDEDLLHKRKNFVGPPSKMTRRLIKPKKKKKKKGANDQEVAQNGQQVPLKKPKSKAKKRAPRLKKFLSYNDKPRTRSGQGNRNISAPKRRKEPPRGYAGKAPRMTRSRPPLRTGKRKNRGGPAFR